MIPIFAIYLRFSVVLSHSSFKASVFAKRLPGRVVIKLLSRCLIRNNVSQARVERDARRVKHVSSWYMMGDT